ncbi:fibronectin type III domain-containing protein [Candidatus Micrarchaeota archaeon]|nr:fibronectin type III domain-containing protein [Candidatus Micrarchaeota archaeon]
MRFFHPALLLLILLFHSILAGAPGIANVNCADFTYDSMAIHWDTNISATSQVFYGLKSNETIYNVTVLEDVNSHSVTLINLTSNTSYYFYSKSCVSDECASSLIYDCKTLGVIPPAITNVGTRSVGDTFASIKFNVNPRSDGSVMWGIKPNDYINWQNDSQIFDYHSFAIKDLFYAKTYYYRVTACYKAGCAVSDEYTFKTEPDLIPPEITDSFWYGFISKEGSQVAIGILTNEPSDCKYSSDANRTYYSKSLSFDNYSAINHTKAIPIEANRDYLLFVKCADVHGNPMKEDYEIRFSTGNVYKASQKPNYQTETNQTPPSKTNQTIPANPNAQFSKVQSQFEVYLSYAAFVFISIAFAYSLSHFLKKQKSKKSKISAQNEAAKEAGAKSDPSATEAPTENKSEPDSSSEPKSDLPSSDSSFDASSIAKSDGAPLEIKQDSKPQDSSETKAESENPKANPDAKIDQQSVGTNALKTEIKPNVPKVKKEKIIDPDAPLKAKKSHHKKISAEK